MKIRIQNEGPDTTIEFRGKLDRSLSTQQREQLFASAKPGCRLLFDFSELHEISSAGLRMLLLYCRHVWAIGGAISLNGASQELKDIAEAAGFAWLLGQGSALVKKPIALTPQRMEIDAYPTNHYAGFALRPGFPIPFGATLAGRGINFSIFSRHATACTLVLFEPENQEPFAEIPFPAEFRVGDVFVMIVFDLDYENLEYGFRMDGPFMPQQGHRFEVSRVLLDPMARSISGREVWGAEPDHSHHHYPYRARIVPEDFDWESIQPPGLPFEELVIYEMHVRGFTRGSSSGAKYPGTFAGLKEKISYLKELGVNCVELLPIFEFDEQESRINPLTQEHLWNFWGYSTIGFYAPKAGFAATGCVGMQADELKSLIKELHRNKIEVILDVVFNHTAEGNEAGPTLSFRGLDNRAYYMLTPEGQYYNFSGCGNTMNCNHPVVRGFVIDCLRYWVAEYHIDGFRFDLASILGRDQNGAPLPNPPLLEALAADPVLGKTKLIAEAWDAGGLYQVGSFPAYERWAEWNGRFRDCARRFLKGDEGQVKEMANRLAGSPDMYHDRASSASINFVTCHDGFTLADLVSYNHKHNEANGEDNRDGANDNHSWNCGMEGPTEDAAINALRRQQIKNALMMLFLSRGVPMLLMGDECGRTQQGNNNAYCHDGPLTWFDWSLSTTNAGLLRFCRLMVRFRQQHPWPAGTMEDSLELSWHGTQAWHPDWSTGSRVLAFMRRRIRGNAHGEIVYAAMNMYWEPLEFELPSPPEGGRWLMCANTGVPTPEDIWESGQEPVLSDQKKIHAAGRSIIVLVAR